MLKGHIAVATTNLNKINVGRKIDQNARKFLKKKGLDYGHGTGHGVGLEIHEAPRISQQKDILQSGQVVTVEPGLYYRGIGGVRIEDTVVVRPNNCENLTSFPKKLEIA